MIDLEIVREMVRKTRAEQGLPTNVSDPSALSRIAGLVTPHGDDGKHHRRTPAMSAAIAVPRTTALEAARVAKALLARDGAK